MCRCNCRGERPRSPIKRGTVPGDRGRSPLRKTAQYDVVGIDTPCIDLNLNLTNYPAKGLGEGIRQLNWQGGGKVATGIVACARLGAKCAMMGSAGDDIFGRFIISDFIRHGIDTSAMQIKTGETSPLSVVLSEAAHGTRTILYSDSSGAHYSHANINEDMLRSTKYFFISQANSVTNRAADIARESGAKIFIDADSYCTKIVDMLPKIDIFVGSEFFYREMFADGLHESNCRKVMDMGPQIVLFTFGENGCAGVSGQGFFTLPAFPVNVVDTVGAGDVFHGAFLAGLLQNCTVKEAARFASAVAAIKCTRIGGRAGIPNLQTAERFLQDGFIDYTEIDQRVKYYERGLEYAKNQTSF